MLSSYSSITPIVLILRASELTLVDPRRDLRSALSADAASRESYIAAGWLHGTNSDPTALYEDVSKRVPCRGWRFDEQTGTWGVERRRARAVHRGPVTVVWNNPAHADVFVDVQRAEMLIDAVQLPDDHLDFGGADPTRTGWFTILNEDGRSLDAVMQGVAGGAEWRIDDFRVVRRYA